MQLKVNRPKIWPDLQSEKKVYLISPAYPNSDAEIAEMVLFLRSRDVETILFDFPNTSSY